MAEQEALTGPATKFDPMQHGLWNRYVDAGQINQGAWMRACATGEFVGTCRQCGSYLIPARPEEVTENRKDYEARCSNPHVAEIIDGRRRVSGCGWLMNAPNGVVLRKSSRLHERPKGA